MAKLTVVQEHVVEPPKTYVLEMTEREALALVRLVGETAGTGSELYEIFDALDKDDELFERSAEFFKVSVSRSGRTPRLDRV